MNLRLLATALRALAAAVAVMLPLAVSAQPDNPFGKPTAMERYIHAPELQPNDGWLNTDRPLRFAHELRGHVVLLDFWTYCCINCMHILPDLEYLEEKYKDQPFVVIGVHSAKFENEASTETIRAAIGRYEIHHPVVVDRDMAIWNAFAARGWPTFVLVDSKGYVVGQTSGEGNRELLDRAVAQLLEIGRQEGSLAQEPLHINRAGTLAPTGDLAYPGKVLADPAGKRLFIADTNHNRIVVSSLPDAEGRADLIALMGNGEEGTADGSYSTASFNHPQGMAIRGDVLYVADTENHLIRAVDLKEKRIETIAGTGKQAYDRRGGNIGTRQGLSSPWDLAVHGDDLWIAMAGPHQIWRMDLSTQEVHAVVGSGRENIVDAVAAEAQLAQPSGLAFLGNKLYFADSETSSIRSFDLQDRHVRTLVGEGLFVFGKDDGPFEEARLQHPLGVTVHGGSLLVADTYNHSIRHFDLENQRVTTLYGTGSPAARTEDGQVGFFEPGGLHAAEGRLYVADTNNHRVVQVDLETGAWQEVKITGLRAPGPKRDRSPAIAAAPHKAPTSGKLTLHLSADLPPGMHPNAEAPMQVTIRHGDTVLAKQTSKQNQLPVTVELKAMDLPQQGELEVVWSFAYCSEGNNAQCFPARLRWTLPVEKADGATHTIELAGKVGR